MREAVISLYPEGDTNWFGPKGVEIHKPLSLQKLVKRISLFVKTTQWLHKEGNNLPYSLVEAYRQVLSDITPPTGPVWREWMMGRFQSQFVTEMIEHSPYQQKDVFLMLLMIMGSRERWEESRVLNDERFIWTHYVGLPGGVVLVPTLDREKNKIIGVYGYQVVPQTNKLDFVLLYDPSWLLRKKLFYLPKIIKQIGRGIAENYGGPVASFISEQLEKTLPYFTKRSRKILVEDAGEYGNIERVERSKNWSKPRKITATVTAERCYGRKCYNVTWIATGSEFGGRLYPDSLREIDRKQKKKDGGGLW